MCTETVDRAPGTGPGQAQSQGGTGCPVRSTVVWGETFWGAPELFVLFQWLLLSVVASTPGLPGAGQGDVGAEPVKMPKADSTADIWLICRIPAKLLLDRFIC